MKSWSIKRRKTNGLAPLTLIQSLWLRGQAPKWPSRRKQVHVQQKHQPVQKELSKQPGWQNSSRGKHSTSKATSTREDQESGKELRIHGWVMCTSVLYQAGSGNPNAIHWSGSDVRVAQKLVIVMGRGLSSEATASWLLNYSSWLLKGLCNTKAPRSNTPGIHKLLVTASNNHSMLFPLIMPHPSWNGIIKQTIKVSQRQLSIKLSTVWKVLSFTHCEALE